MGLSLYFASQGAGRLFGRCSAVPAASPSCWSAAGLALRLTGSLEGLFAALALGLFAYGILLLSASARRLADGENHEHADRQFVRGVGAELASAPLLCRARFAAAGYSRPALAAGRRTGPEIRWLQSIWTPAASAEPPWPT